MRWVDVDYRELHEVPRSIVVRLAAGTIGSFATAEDIVRMQRWVTLEERTRRF